MTRGEKNNHSPHTSPKPSRRTPSQETAASSSSKSVSSQISGKIQKIPVSVSSGSSSSASSTSSSRRTPPLDAPVIEPIKLSNITKDQEAPPIPPRKSMNFSNEINRSLKPLLPIPVTPLAPPTDRYETHQIPDRIQPKSTINLAQEENYDDEDDDDDESNLIFGPPETISGIIDTRPLEQRTNYISFASLTNNVTSNFNLITVNDPSSASKDGQANSSDANKINSNTYLLKNNQLNNNNSSHHINGTNHQRHMSVPVGGNSTPVKTLPTSSSTFQASISNQAASNSPFKAGPSSKELYENVNLKAGASGNLIQLNNINNNSNSSNVPYENINLEYINRLMNEGYSKERVVTALGISRNNFEMAFDILHEFASTNHQSAAGKVARENNR